MPGLSVLEEFSELRQQLNADVEKIERVLNEVELQYLQAENSQYGSVLKGFEGFLSSKDALRKRSRILKTEDRQFSLSSRTSPAVRDQEQAAADAAAENQAAVAGGFGKKGYAQKSYAQKQLR